MKKILFLCALLVIGCDENTEHTDDWSYDSTSAWTSPQCPAPSSPLANHYHDNGGAANALTWYLLMNHAFSGHNYHYNTHTVVHKYHPIYSRPTVSNRPRSFSTFKPNSSVGFRTRSSTTFRSSRRSPSFRSGGRR